MIFHRSGPVSPDSLATTCALTLLRLSTSAVRRSGSSLAAGDQPAGLKTIERLSRLATEMNARPWSAASCRARLRLGAYASRRRSRCPRPRRWSVSPAEDRVDAAPWDVPEAGPRHHGLLHGDRRVQGSSPPSPVAGSKPSARSSAMRGARARCGRRSWPAAPAAPGGKGTVRAVRSASQGREDVARQRELDADQAAHADALAMPSVEARSRLMSRSRPQ